MLSDKLQAIMSRAAETSAADGPSLALLEEVWPTLLGEDLASRTRPGGWSEGVLTVLVGSLAWRKELWRHRRRLHRRVAARLPWRVDELRFELGDVPARRTPPPAAAEADDEEDRVEQARRRAPADLDGLEGPTADLLARIGAHLARERDGDGD